MVGIVFVALLSGLLVIPQVRAVAGALLASGAVLGIIIGFAAQRTLGNFVAGIMIAFTQPLRLGDRIVVRGQRGRRRGDQAHVHVRPRRRRHQARDPQRETGLGYHPQLHDRRPGAASGDHGAGSIERRPRERHRAAARRVRGRARASRCSSAASTAARTITRARARRRSGRGRARSSTSSACARSDCLRAAGVFA